MAGELIHVCFVAKRRIHSEREQPPAPTQHTCPQCRKVPVSHARIWCPGCHETFIAGPMRELERERARKYVRELDARVGADSEQGRGTR